MPRYRSRFEARCAKTLGGSFAFEAITLPYVLTHSYLPDFVDQKRRIMVECKGRFTSVDRTKMLTIKRQHPDWRIILWFMEPNRLLRRGSKTSYRAWALKYGFEVYDPSTVL